MGMIRGGGRTSAAPTLTHQQPSLDSGHMAIQAEWVQTGGRDNCCEDFCSAFNDDIYISAR